MLSFLCRGYRWQLHLPGLLAARSFGDSALPGTNAAPLIFMKPEGHALSEADNGGEAYVSLSALDFPCQQSLRSDHAEAVPFQDGIFGGSRHPCSKGRIFCCMRSPRRASSTPATTRTRARFATTARSAGRPMPSSSRSTLTTSPTGARLDGWLPAIRTPSPSSSNRVW